MRLDRRSTVAAESMGIRTHVNPRRIPCSLRARALALIAMLSTMPPVPSHVLPLITTSLSAPRTQTQTHSNYSIHY